MHDCKPGFGMNRPLALNCLQNISLSGEWAGGMGVAAASEKKTTKLERMEAAIFLSMQTC